MNQSSLRVNKTVPHQINLVLGRIKDYYSNLAKNRLRNFLKKLPKFPHKFTLHTVTQHYKSIIQSDATVFKNTKKCLKQLVWIIYLVAF